MPIFFLLFIGLSLIKVYFLIEVCSIIGAVPTITLSILCAMLCAWLVRCQGFGVLMRVRDSLARDEVPALELLDGALLLVTSLFLLLPSGLDHNSAHLVQSRRRRSLS